jgi:UDP-glucose 4-epimerase
MARTQKISERAKNDYRVQLVKDYLSAIRFDPALAEAYRGRKILVTGGVGAIGSNLVVALSELVSDKGLIVVLDNLSAIRGREPWNLPSLPNVLFVQGDVRNQADLKRVFRERPSMVFHLAAFFANQNSVDYPDISAQVDILALIQLLDLSVFSGVEKFVYASSGCAIYGSYPKLPVTEDFISLDLTTPYQINKMTGEMYCNYYHHHYGLPVAKCRFFNSYGPGEVPGQYRNVIPNFIYWARNGVALPITGDGKATRDFTYVLDLVQGLVKAGHSEEAIGESFNLASGKEITITELAHDINKLAGNSREFHYSGQRRWDTKIRMWASIEKAESLLGYHPMVQIQEGLKNNFEWFRLFSDEIDESADFAPGLNPALKQ